MRPHATLLPPSLRRVNLLRAKLRHRPSAIVSLTLLLLPAVLLRTTAMASAAEPDRPVVACVDPRATLLLTDPVRSGQYGAKRGAGRRATLWRRGRCFIVRPGERWERIYSVGGLVIMRRAPPEAGVPPLYFRLDAAAAIIGGVDEASRGRSVPKPMDDPSPGMPARSAPAPGNPGVQIRVEPLPPLPVPSSPGASAVGPAAPMPSAPVPTSAHPADAAPDRPKSPLPTPDVSVTAERSYEVGFVIAIMLVTVLLALLALLGLVLLRRSPDRLRPNWLLPNWLRQPPRVEPIGEPMPPPMLQALPPEPAVRTPPPIPEPAPARVAVDRPASAAAIQGELRPVGPRSLAAWPPELEAGTRDQCARLLRKVGWQASIQPLSGRHHASVVAQRAGRLMVLHCLPGSIPVDEQAVEEACMAREREQADMAVIVSNGGYTPGARHLAARVGVDLLHEDELPAFAA